MGVKLLSLFMFGTFTFLSAAVVDDLKKYPQNIYEYEIKVPQIDNTFLEQKKVEFRNYFFMVWDNARVTLSKEDAMWGLLYKRMQSYGANYRLLSDEWFEKLMHNADFDSYNTQKLNAISVNNANMRVFPTIEPIFLDPNRAGEGFPFDYNQNTGVKINTPLKISHFSKDKQWVFVETNYAGGWLHVNDVAIVSPTIIRTFKQSRLYGSIEENFPIYRNGFFRENIKLGTVIPKSRLGNFFVIARYDNMQGYIQTIPIDDHLMAPLPMPMNEKNIKYAINQLMGETYGWGELYFKRDCSALTRDFFALFGIYLGRNSYAQTKNGNYIDIKDLSHQEKKDVIRAKAKPFLSIIYMRGHVMLYIGEFDGEPLVFHSFWGVTTTDELGNEGRVVVGKTAITSLQPGIELVHYDSGKNILERIEGIVLIE